MAICFVRCLVRQQQQQRLTSNFCTVRCNKKIVPKVLTPSQKFTLCIGHCLDHVFSVIGIKEEHSTFCIRDEFDKICVPAH